MRTAELTFALTYGTCFGCCSQGVMMGSEVQKIHLLVKEDSYHTKGYCITCAFKKLDELKKEVFEVENLEKEYYWWAKKKTGGA